jgi:heavy metal translocating P-type ATPase
VLKVYAPAVLLLAAAAVLGWTVGPLLFGGTPDLERAVFAGLTVLVMGYPCALGVSAPLSIVRGAGEAAERGILMRTGEAFQGYRLATHVVFDKTGTLTAGRPALREIIALGESQERLLAIAAAAESASEHPLAAAVLAAAMEKRIAPLEVSDFSAVPGRGVCARIGGDDVVVGSPKFLAEEGIALAGAAERLRLLEAAGHTVIAVATMKRVRGLLAFGDPVRAEARAVVAQLKHMGLRTLIVSGDNAGATHRVGVELGLDEVHAQLLPQDKARLIRELQRGGSVAMVGDGINDAPALMQANIGIAMGGGTDIAIDAADIIILNNRLDAVLEAREVSRWSYRKMLQNVTLAVLFNGIGVPLAATGLIHPIWAMAAMAVSVTAIFYNSLRGKPRLFFDTILSVGGVAPAPQPP